MEELKKISKVLQTLEDESENLKKFKVVLDELDNLNKSVNSKLDLIKKSNDELIKASSKLNSFIDENSKKIDEHYKDNKLFQKDLDQSIASRLSKHKSDIKIKIDDKFEAIETTVKKDLSQNFNEQHKFFKDMLLTQNQYIQRNTIFLVIILILILGSAAYYFKQFIL